jgi:VIT1/CCC1 family predicted Fe2+/Mn2+ transporter
MDGKSPQTMKPSLQTGFSFGLTSGIITTLGIIVGLHSSTQSKIVVVGGILTIAIADAFSDALGIHISQETQNKLSHKQVWGATISAFLSKFVFALTFLIPILVFHLTLAVVISIIWGFSVLSALSFAIARKHNKNPWKMVAEHITIGLVVILATFFVGKWIASVFK